MDQATINRYQAVNPDTGQQGDIYASLLAEHGQSCADACAAAALTGDETQINAALALYEGTTTPTVAVPLANTSTLSIFGTQLATDPLAAPLAGANTLAGNTILSFLKNPWVVAIVVGYLFFFMGGGGMLKGILNKKGGAK